jgi:hypothetical protein
VNIEEIKKKTNEAFYDGPVQDEVLYLLSIIEQAEKENRRLQDELQRFKYRPTREEARKLGIIPKP